MREAHLVCTDKADSECSQDLDDSRAAVASDRVKGSDLGHAVPPEHVLTHQGPKVGHNKCILFNLQATRPITQGGELGSACGLLTNDSHTKLIQMH